MAPSDAEERTEDAVAKKSFCLEVTESFLKHNPLDTVLSKRSAIGTLGQRKPEQQFLANAAKATSSSSAVTQGDWSSLEASLSIRKTPVVAPSRMAIAREWQSMPSLKMTPEMERDLRVIENRQHIDPKRFYKSSGTGRKKGELPTTFAFGTVISAPHEFYSSRLVRRDRRKTFTEEIMADRKIMNYTKTRVRKIQKHATRQRRVVDPAAKKERRAQNRR